MIYEAKKQITYNDIDSNWDVTLTAVLKYMNEATWISGEQLKIGVSQIPKTGIAFVTQRIAIKVIHLPRLGDEFTIRTWPDGIKRSTFTRKGEFLDQAGQKLIEWESLWVLFDVNERKIKRPSELEVALPQHGNLGVEVVTEKIKVPTEVKDGTAFTHQVQFSELDTYQHMSNINYGNLLANVYMINENRSTFMRDGAEIQFNYTNEGQLGDEILVTLSEGDHQLFVTGSTTNHQVFIATIKQEEVE